ncbi:SRPBCC domain-containing protein [Streptomyces sp. NPDC048219]|uniref:SRPBCC family protein n=1 Tax=Streptomyces sp. NPDC048219 TaxID=3365517 RepID=UPI003716782B
MTLTSLDKDVDHLALTLVADFTAPVDRVWQLWADPRQLERWWGPPTYPATVEEHDLIPGGDVTYFMTGPDGDRYRGWWRITSVDAPTSLEFTDGFADQDGAPSTTMPTMAVRVRLSEHGDGTRMEMRSVFDTAAHMEQLTDMGMVDGLREAVGQMDALLAG